MATLTNEQKISLSTVPTVALGTPGAVQCITAIAKYPFGVTAMAGTVLGHAFRQPFIIAGDVSEVRVHFPNDYLSAAATATTTNLLIDMVSLEVTSGALAGVYPLTFSGGRTATIIPRTLEADPLQFADTLTLALARGTTGFVKGYMHVAAATNQIPTAGTYQGPFGEGSSTFSTGPYQCHAYDQAVTTIGNVDLAGLLSFTNTIPAIMNAYCPMVYGKYSSAVAPKVDMIIGDSITCRTNVYMAQQWIAFDDHSYTNPIAAVEVALGGIGQLIVNTNAPWKAHLAYCNRVREMIGTNENNAGAALISSQSLWETYKTRGITQILRSEIPPNSGTFSTPFKSEANQAGGAASYPQFNAAMKTARGSLLLDSYNVWHAYPTGIRGAVDPDKFGVDGTTPYCTLSDNGTHPSRIDTVTGTCTGACAGTVFTCTTFTSGFFAVGQTLVGTGITGAPTIISLGTGTGNNNGGTYNISSAQTAGPTTITTTRATDSPPTGQTLMETEWRAVVQAVPFTKPA